MTLIPSWNSAAYRAFFALTELFFPRLCIPCGRKLIDVEQFLCLHCWHDLPRTNYHSDADNKVAQLFWGRASVNRATAWLLFRKGSQYQQLIHFLKYKGYREVGRVLGYQFGMELIGSPFAGNDIILPIPLHRSRMRVRGFNQSEYIALGLSEALQIPMLKEPLTRSVKTGTQTRKNRYERWQNVADIFLVEDRDSVTDKRVLLVDDVVTTGATLEAAVNTLLKAGAASVDIATLAVADF